MAENTKIEWAHHTFNPWRGCTKVSEGCANCYAASFSKRNPKTLGVWGEDGTRIVAAHAQWTMPLKWNADAAKSGERYRVFCASLADVFEDWTGPVLAPNGEQVWGCPGCLAVRTSPLNQAPTCGTCDLTSHPYTLAVLRRRFFAMVDATPHLDWLLVTKRPENIQRFWPTYYPGGYIPEAGDMNQPGPRRNVWLLTSVENQEQAEKRIPALLKCRDLAPVLGLSCEPLLGPVNFRWLLGPYDLENLRREPGTTDHLESLLHLDWVICGGESGDRARPMHHDWARSLRDQCQEAGVPFFFKQWGEWSPFSQIPPSVLSSVELDNYPMKVIDYADKPGDFCGRSYHKLGKSLAGRVLDGVTWDQFPTVSFGDD